MPNGGSLDHCRKTSFNNLPAQFVKFTANRPFIFNVDFFAKIQESQYLCDRKSYNTSAPQRKGPGVITCA